MIGKLVQNCKKKKRKEKEKKIFNRHLTYEVVLVA